jgi:hypothetical protein
MGRPVGQDQRELRELVDGLVAPPIDRTASPLFCRYNGILLGQLLSLAYAPAGRAGYTSLRAGIHRFLDDIGLEAALPPEPPVPGGAGHAALLTRLLPALAARSRDLAEAVVLGGLLVQYGLLAGHEPGIAASMLAEMERLRLKGELPPIEPARLALPPHGDDPDAVLAPALAYLREAIARLPIEGDLAFVLMPLETAYAGFHASFYRPALELCGYRTCRAWSGLTSGAHADVVLALIEKVGFVWVDVSELTAGIAHDIGAAHAHGKPAALVARVDRAAALPGAIGRDAVLRYDPAEPDWPSGAVMLMGACLASLQLAADRGERIRLEPDSIARAFDTVSNALQHVLLPREALDAQRRARRALDAGDFGTAEAGFDAACRMGLCDDETRLWRGWTRLGLGRLADAAVDLDALVGGSDPEVPAGEWRPIAAYMRGILREAQADLRGALADYDLALALGLPDADVRPRRDALAARLAAI